MRIIRTTVLVATATFALASPSRAATINVSSSCSFDQAVQALNTRSVVGGCAPGNGSADTIKVPAGTFPIAVTRVSEIGRSVQIVGAGRNSTKLVCSRPEDQDHLAGGVALSISGRIFSTPLTVTLRSLTVAGGGGNNVGGIYQENGDTEADSVTVTLDDVHVHSFPLPGIINTAGVGSMTIVNSLIDFMDVNLNNGVSGAISNAGTMTISRSTIANNFSMQGPGIYNSGDLQVYASTLANNSSDWDGGAMYNRGHAIVGHCTFSGNATLGRGGAIYMPQNDSGATLQMYFSTVVFNSADGSGGGIAEAMDGVNSILLQDNIISRNNSPTAPDVTADLQFFGRNLITNSQGVVNALGNTIFGAVPSLGPLITVDSAPATHALLPGSAGIDQGVADENFFNNSLDQRGFPRPMDGNNNGVSEYDLGAVEFDPWQTERLAVAAKSSDTHSIISNDSTYSNAQGTWLQANAASDFVTYRVPFPAAGTYNIKVRMRRANNRGRFQVQTASNLTGTYTNLGSTQDGYASTAGFVEVNIGNFTVSSFGSKYLRFLINGKNSASSGYYLTLDYLKITKQ